MTNNDKWCKLQDDQLGCSFRLFDNQACNSQCPYKQQRDAMTAREFVLKCNLDDNEVNLSKLTRYTNSQIDYSQFPDADIDIDTIDYAEFQEYVGK